MNTSAENPCIAETAADEETPFIGSPDYLFCLSVRRFNGYFIDHGCAGFGKFSAKANMIPR